MENLRERNFCRRCENLRVRAGGGGRRPFAIPGSKPHYAPDLPFRVEHILLDLTIDPKGKTLKGTVTHKVRVVAPEQKKIRLDQIGLKIDEVKVSGQTVKATTSGHELWIDLPQTPAVGDNFEFSVKYSAANPRRGLYFTGPDADYPNKPYQVWSQGQDEDSRFWFPTFDYPNQKATSEVIATVPKGFTAVSNGALLSKKDSPDGTRYHYKLGTPHVTYLITLTVAEFSVWADQGPRGLPVQYFVQPGREEDGKRAFSNTPKMIEVFEKKTGMPYPYEKYSQVAVQDFIFGGMENTSATTQTDYTLHDSRAHIDFSSDPLVSHELAHQWFGDLLTCRDWSHGWLNEGFATFMERVWVENNTGPGGGAEEAKYYAYQDLQEYLENDGEYRRPIVCNTYIEPIDLFDPHLYQKGGLVLNLVRQILGEDSFWKSIQLYVSRHKGGSVETLDLIRAIEDATGKNLRRIFDQWIFSAGFPEFEIAYTWHDEKKMAELVIEQKQTGGLPSVTADGAMTPLFQLPIVIDFIIEGGQKISQKIDLFEARERLFISTPSKPQMVRFDVQNAVPKTLKFPRPKEMLLYQLTQDPDCMGRIEAIKELIKISDPEIVRALSKAAMSDAFWGVQVEAAKALSDIRSDLSRDGLITALKTAHPKARRGVAISLGSYKDEIAAQALRKLAEKDESYYVEADATAAFAQSRARTIPGPSPAEIDETEKFLIAQLGKSSYRESIRGAAFRALAALPGIGKGERPKALQTMMDWTKRGQVLDARGQAIIALGGVAKTATIPEQTRILNLLNQLADEDHFRIRMAVIVSLDRTEAPAAISILEKIRVNDLDGRVRRNCQIVRDALRGEGTMPESVQKLKESLEKLEEEHRKLRASMEEFKGMGAK